MIRGPKEKKERSLGVRLQLKGERCLSPKCAFVRKPYGPGAHGRDRKRVATLSDFGRQLKEKQKCKLVYGIDERALRQVFGRAFRRKGSTVVNLIQILESRLDSVVFRMGIAPSRSAARQLVIHGHIMVNKHKVRAPGYMVKAGDEVSVRPESMGHANFKNVKESLKNYEPPAWLRLDPEGLTGTVLGPPESTEVPFETNVLVEAFSK